MANLGKTTPFRLTFLLRQLAVLKILGFPASFANDVVVMLALSRLELEAGQTVAEVATPNDSSVLECRQAPIEGHAIQVFVF